MLPDLKKQIKNWFYAINNTLVHFESWPYDVLFQWFHHNVTTKLQDKIQYVESRQTQPQAHGTSQVNNKT